MSDGLLQPNQFQFQPTQMLTIELAAQEWNVVLMGLNEIPTKFGMPVLQKITAQFEEIRQHSQTGQNIGRPMMPNMPRRGNSSDS